MYQVPFQTTDQKNRLEAHESKAIDILLKEAFLRQGSLLHRIQLGATPEILGGFKDAGTGLPLYGKMSVIPKDELIEFIKKDLSFFRECCGMGGIESYENEESQKIAVNDNHELIEAITFWRLKTGKSLGELIEQLVYMNQSVHRSDWLQGTSVPGSHREGSVSCLVGFPATGKTKAAAQIRMIPNLLVIDTDAFRAAVFGKEILDRDGEFLDQRGLGQWAKTQYLYTRSINKVFAFTVRGVAGLLAREGFDIVTTGLAASPEADRLFFIETETLTLDSLKKQVKSNAIPKPELLEEMIQNVSKLPPNFFADQGLGEFEKVFREVQNRVRERVKVERQVGKLIYSRDPESIIVNQVFGINSRMNDFDIARVICGTAHDVCACLQKQIPVFPLKHEIIPAGIDSDEIRNFQEKIQEIINIKKDAGIIRPGYFPWVQPKVIEDPSHIIAKRADIVSAADTVLSRLCDGITDTLYRQRIRHNIERKIPRLDEIHRAARHMIGATIGGLFGRSNPQREHQKLWSDILGNQKEDNEELQNIFKFVLFRILKSTTTNHDGIPVFSLPQRYEPSLNRKIASIVHSGFTLFGLGIHFFKEDFTTRTAALCVVHDGLEEATLQRETDGVLSEGIFYSSTIETQRELSRDLVDGFPQRGHQYSAASKILTEVRTTKELSSILEESSPLFLNFHFQKLIAVEGYDSLNQSQRNRIFKSGPISFVLVAQQERFAVKLLLEQAALGTTSNHREFACDMLKVAILDRYDDIITLDRYIVPHEGNEFDPMTGRLKVLTYTGRLLYTFSQLSEALSFLPSQEQYKFARAFRDYIPMLHRVIVERINPHLKAAALAPISEMEIHEYYKIQYLPFIKTLEEKLIPLAYKHVENALAPYLESQSH